MRRGVSCWLGLILLLANLLGIGLMPPRDASAGPAPFAEELSGDRMVICTAAGMVVIDSNGNVVDTGTGTTSHGDLCVFCLPLMHGGIQMPILASHFVAPTIPAGAEVPAWTAPIPKPVRLTGAHSPRAPPQA